MVSFLQQCIYRRNRNKNTEMDTGWDRDTVEWREQLQSKLTADKFASVKILTLTKIFRLFEEAGSKKLGKLRKIVDHYDGNLAFFPSYSATVRTVYGGRRDEWMGNGDGLIFPTGDIHKN